LSKNKKNNERKSYKIVNKRNDPLPGIHVQEAQKNKKEETIIMMTETIRENHPKIEKTRRKIERIKREIDEDYKKIEISFDFVRFI